MFYIRLLVFPEFICIFETIIWKKKKEKEKEKEKKRKN